MMFECMGVCAVSTAHESKVGGCPVYVYMVKHLFGFFLQI